MKFKNKAIFLDRDGVVNKAIVKNGIPYPPKKLNDLFLYPEINDIISTLKKVGYFIIIVTNQPDVRRGIQKKEIVEKILKIVKLKLNIDSIYTCYHDNHDNCECRKPKSGLLLQASYDFNLDLSKCWLIGDRWKDIDAGQNVVCKTIFIDHNYSERKPYKPTYIVKKHNQITSIIVSNIWLNNEN